MSASAPPLRAYVLAFTTIYLVWGSTYLAIRVAVESMPPFAMAATRFLSAGAIFLLFLRWRGAGRLSAAQWKHAAVTGFFLLLGGNGLVSWAEQYIASGMTALIIGTGPLFVALVEWAWPGGHRPSLWTSAAMLLGFAGVAWLAAPWDAAASESTRMGAVLAILIACLSWAIGSIYGRQVSQPAEPFTVAAAQMLAGGAWLALVATARGEFASWDFAATTMRSWAAFAYLLFAGSLAGYSAFVWLMRHSTPTRTATFAYVNPVVAVFLGWLLLDEPITGRTLAASALIVASVVAITWPRARTANHA